MQGFRAGYTKCRGSWQVIQIADDQCTILCLYAVTCMKHTAHPDVLSDVWLCHLFFGTFACILVPVTGVVVNMIARTCSGSISVMSPSLCCCYPSTHPH